MFALSTLVQGKSANVTVTVNNQVQDGIRTKGHILFFFPIITKSAKITFMPVAEEMAKRGHQVIKYSSFNVLYKYSLSSSINIFEYGGYVLVRSVRCVRERVLIMM